VLLLLVLILLLVAAPLLMFLLQLQHCSFVASRLISSLSVNFSWCNHYRCITHGAIIVVALSTVQSLSLHCCPRCSHYRFIAVHGAIIIAALSTVQSLSLHRPQCNHYRCITHDIAIFYAGPLWS
jgi:hypothetical protein